MSEAHLLKQALRAVLSGQQRAAADPHRPAWHLAPPVGLMNDPNGFIHFNQRFVLCYQWNPLACAHGAKFWGQWSSQDLVNWRHEPLALAPSEPYESHGCYSGSAVDNQGVMTLLYTGNVKFDDGSRTAWQCLATRDEHGEFHKSGPVLALPEGYTGHVRDPKVWQHNGLWYMVLGAQNLELQGKVLLFSSPDLHQWISLGEIAGSHLNGLGDFGYMWECPDLFELDGRSVLVVCPQGLKADTWRWRNTFQSGYFCGSFDYANHRFDHGEFHELDLGFEFYAPQTCLSDDGRRLMIGWMGIPDGDEFYQPTRVNGWMHTMTCPRELILRGDRLFQHPARELQQLRGQESRFAGVARSLPTLAIDSAELELSIDGSCELNFADTLRLTVHPEGVTLLRNNLRSGEPENRDWRGEVSLLRILCDRSSIEIFINEGEAVMSSRYFPASTPTVSFDGIGQIGLSHWSLQQCVIE
ncbi:sucrose-6-phosphate hydrolase [Erwinia sorbitola]|uniref:Sucrose-6-phosphate hydrolase n=1 Tax=Erwinia sorbitola TaxID=2681984 RepID=A0A6I6ESQ4_9GAMM|nr:sucrose-6-phosphate hydrolase [Erwinia sorbitola]MTD26162.1 sucrose-6-phosphate hydrolase [Erwinia sorbitola]QGU87303.1 sucrose-6-phosphate hydrolase [Erwinia sorbitola]